MPLHWYFCDEWFGCRCIGTFVMSGLKNKFKSQSSKYYYQEVVSKELENLQKQKLDKISCCQTPKA